MAGLVLKYGDYPFDPGAMTLTAAVETLRNPGGVPITMRCTMTGAGWLQADDETSLDAKISECSAALAIPYLDLVLYLSDGVTPSTMRLRNAGSTTGVCVTKGAGFDRSTGAELGTLRHVTFVATAEYPHPSLDVLSGSAPADGSSYPGGTGTTDSPPDFIIPAVVGTGIPAPGSILPVSGPGVPGAAGNLSLFGGTGGLEGSGFAGG